MSAARKTMTARSTPPSSKSSRAWPIVFVESTPARPATTPTSSTGSCRACAASSVSALSQAKTVCGSWKTSPSRSHQSRSSEVELSALALTGAGYRPTDPRPPLGPPRPSNRAPIHGLRDDWDVDGGVTCPSCQTVSVPGGKFCSECGTPLAMSCPSCGAVAAPTAKFCAECGTGLAGAPPTAPEVPRAPAPAAERRLVTVLFADLVGFTPLSESRDAEEVRELLSRYVDTARRVIGALRRQRREVHRRRRHGAVGRADRPGGRRRAGGARRARARLRGPGARHRGRCT